MGASLKKEIADVVDHKVLWVQLYSQFYSGHTVTRQHAVCYPGLSDRH